MQYKYIHVSCFEYEVDEMRKKIKSHYHDKDKYWRTAIRIANDLQLPIVTQRETRIIGVIMQEMNINTRIYRGYKQFMI